MPIDTVILSVTPVCNMACTYCQNEPVFSGFPESPMDLELVKKLSISYGDIVTKENGKILRFCYSGGEPLLVGLDYFKELVSLQRDLIGDSFCIENTIQTNGTLINREWADFFKCYNFGVSVSIDGPPSIHNLQRPLSERGISSLEKVIQGISFLRNIGVRFGTLTVVSQNSVDHANEIFNFVSALRPNMMGFLPCVDRGPIITPKYFGKFMIDLFDAWIEKGDPQLLIREFVYIIQGMLGIRHTKGCQYAGDCPRHINVAPNGSVSVCDQYIGKSDGYLGNIRSETLLDIINSERYISFRSNTSLLPISCNKCRYVALCNGGCAYRRNRFQTPDYFCEGRKMMFEHIELRLEDIVSRMTELAMKKCVQKLEES